MRDISWTVPKGAPTVVMRGAQPIGVLSEWKDGTKRRVGCKLHRKCAKLVSSSVSWEACVKWLAEGQDPTQAANREEAEEYQILHQLERPM